jgi:hypothetical protein
MTFAMGPKAAFATKSQTFATAPELKTSRIETVMELTSEGSKGQAPSSPCSRPKK